LSRARQALIALALASGPASAAEVQPLAEGWAIQSSARLGEGAEGARLSRPGVDTSGWHPARVPTTVLAALVEAGALPDPYYGDNLTRIPGYQKAPWLLMARDSPFRDPWWYRVEFEVPAAWAGRHLSLHLDGVNYEANVWVNGERIAARDEVRGMFRRFELPVSGRLKLGARNALAVEVIPPGLLEKLPYDTKQIEATTGWDDHNPYPPDMNMGLWEDVYLKATGPVRLEHPYVVTDLDLPRLDRAELTISVRARNVSEAPQAAVVEARFDGRVVSRSVELAPREVREIRFSPTDPEQGRRLQLEKPRVWWPVGLGEQPLYDLSLEARVAGRRSDRLDTRFGVREATTAIDADGWRYYMVNGRRVLIRGGAWMTTDMMLRLSERRYDALVRYAANAGLNMLRSEGFSIRETDEFYEIADEYGVMVTQQIFGRNIPEEDLAIACVEDMMLRIRNHPSLVHFLGHDETFPTERLDRAYRELIARLTPERTYQPHSGAFDIAERSKTGGTRTGTRELWTYATPGHYYKNREDGAWGFAQSGGIGGIAAALDSMKKMMPTEALWPPTQDTWSLHTVTQGVEYFTTLFDALARRYGEPNGIEDFVRKAFVMNYDSARGMYEAYGRNKPRATGITTWKYDAAWPAALTWQYVDWYLQPTGAYYGAQKACESLHVQYAYDDHGVYVVSDRSEPVRGLEVTATLHDLDLRERWTGKAKVDVEADGVSRALVVDFPPGLSRTHFLHLTLAHAERGPIGDNFYWLSTVPDQAGEKGTGPDGVFRVTPRSSADFTQLHELPKVTVDVETAVEVKGDETVVEVTARNAGDRLAFFVMLALTQGQGGPEVTPAFWSENAFSLLPGARKTVTVRAYTRDLGRATPAIRVGGWNARAAE
jgi:exo-1,4-beta-D-glucosaminidase